MKKLLICLLMPMLAGCLSPVTDRLDSLQAELNHVNSQLEETNKQLARANQQLEKVEIGVRRMGGPNQ